ncbi:MAG: hypothetical protein WA960_05395 [Tunicatimonas sp.]
MMELKSISQRVKDLRKELRTLPFKEDDIRVEFLNFLGMAYYNFYRGHVVLDLSNCIDRNEIQPSEVARNELGDHIKAITMLSQEPVLEKEYLSSLNRNLLIGAWSNFELCVTILCEAVCKEDELEKLLSYQYREICKKLKKSELDPDDVEQLKGLTYKHHLTHIPVTRKTDLLFKKVSGYKREQNEDKEFLKFVGKLRNTMHTNFIYYGKDYNFVFNQDQFSFKNGETVVVLSSFDPYLYLSLINELKEIWIALIKTISYTDIISYPDKNTP